MNRYREGAQAQVEKILRVDTETFETTSSTKNNQNMRADIHICVINGEKYIYANDIYDEFSNRLKTIEFYGYMTKSDMYHFRSDGRIRVFVKVATVAEVKNELTKLLENRWGDEQRIIPVIEKAQEVELYSLAIPQELIEQSEKAYQWRNELLKKSKEYDDEVRKRNDEQAEKALMEKKKEEQGLLKSLVEQIEAMGWHVTLTLKENG